MTKKKLAVIALGGNALLRAGQKGTFEEQQKNVQTTLGYLLDLITPEHNFIMVHGNGPQVGNILLQNHAGSQLHGIPEMPLDVCGAYSQGFIGYLIEQQFRNILPAKDLDRGVVNLITQVLVDKNDPAFAKPTKPIGPYYSKEEAAKLSVDTNSMFQEDPDGIGWRKVVPSPLPTQIGNSKVIEKLARDGHIVIAAGGGGIPVYYDEQKNLKGIDAVIDKDHTSALLASQINADEFYIFTDLKRIVIDDGSATGKVLDVIPIAEAKKYIEEGRFSAGGMAPKVKGAIRFIESGGSECIFIHFPDTPEEPIYQTRIVR
ncbi:MAG: carbamate kinase [Salinivirgaceae bacterium]|nr:carbamate kinase [Salinivirgaceae bacterium]MDD4747304.1 carbamate kinase [Salinivirgaceae bacterium]MDY0281494.1 carbamate kinase [Salinivirgaceae bacterium]